MNRYGVCEEDVLAVCQIFVDGQREAMLLRKLRSLPAVTASGQLVFLSSAQVQQMADNLDRLWAARPGR